MNYSPIMQRNNLFCPGPQNSPTLFAYQPTFQNNANYPEIIGEGDVTYVVLPNGSVQYFFIPNYKRDVWTPFAYNPAAANWNFTTQAWFVRNMPNPTPTSFCYDQHIPPSLCEGPLITSFTTPDFTHTQAIGFNTFHYDKWTSTTDLRYFYPSLCLTSQPQKCTACVQIDTPAANTVCHYEVVCNKPCHCAAKAEKKLKAEAERKSKSVECCMSVGEVKKVTCDCPSHCQISDNSISMDTRSSGSIGKKKKLSLRKKKLVKSDCENKGIKRKKPLIKIIGKCDGACCCSSSNFSTEAE